MPRVDFDREAAGSWFPVALLLLASVLVAALIAPFVGAFFTAAVLAAVLQPWQVRCTRVMGGRAHLAAGLLTAGVILTVLVPLGCAGYIVAREVARLADWTSQTLEHEGFDGLVAPLPEPLRRPGRALLELVPAVIWEGLIDEDSRRGRYFDRTWGDADFGAGDVSGAKGPFLHEPEVLASQRPPGPEDELQGELPNGLSGEPGAALPMDEKPEAEGPDLGDTTRQAQALLGRIGGFLVRTGVLIVALFFLLAEGKQLTRYMLDLMPVGRARMQALLEELHEVTVAVFTSTIVTALAQSTVALIGYSIASLPGLPLVLFATFLCSFIPAVGAAGVTMAAGAVLWLSGKAGMGVFLIIWGLVVVSLVDNFLKPWLTNHRSKLPTSLVFFSMICGITVFGPMGLVAGPLIVALFLVSGRLLRGEPVAAPTE